jgi:hypothetical protein
MLSKLRHPARAIREPFGTAGLIIACVALIAALTGGAYAASGGLTATQKKEVKKIAKQFAGKPGAPGAAGPAGPAGSGTKGDTGAAGTNGTSATAVSFTGSQHGCADGGTEVKSASAPVFVCNGETGFTETLPPGETETGAWTSGGPFISLSFNIPLAEAPKALHFVNEAGEEQTGSGPFEPPVNCLGSAEDPTAPPGNVCVYESLAVGSVSGFSGVSVRFRTGAVFGYGAPAGTGALGTWAVTAAEP